VLFNELCLPPSFLLAVLVSAGARTQTSVRQRSAERALDEGHESSQEASKR